MKRLFAMTVCGAMLAASAAAAAAVAAPKAVAVGACAAPAYPKYSPVMDNIRISMKFLVGPDGMVKRSAVTDGSGVADLDDRALAAFSRCSYRPVQKNGKAVEAWQTMRFDWVVTEQPESK